MLHFGKLGAARIAPPALVTPATMVPGVSVVAVAASNVDKAEALASERGIKGVSACYAELIDSPRIDTIYDAPPPNLHGPWSIAALRAGKHVLCEKPIAMNAIQARRMVEAADVAEPVLLEAFHYRFHPYN